VGYRQNDADIAYIDLGSPAQLSKNQVAHLKQVANGQPAEQKQIKVDSSSNYELSLPLR
jgi:xylan 1,4-beta-xylosidase